MTEEEKNLVGLAQAIKKFSDNWAYENEVIKVKAKICWARYNALRREGFDRVDALCLCTKAVEL